MLLFIIMCLDKIIGLTNNTCLCISNNTLDNSSDSGYYINDILESGMILKLDNSLNCQDPIWEIYKAAKERAIDDFKINLIGSLSNNYTKIVDFKGVIGNLEKAYKIVPSQISSFTYYIKPKNYKSKLTITPGFRSADNGTVDIRLFKNGIQIKTWSISVIAGQNVNAQNSETIDLTDNGVINEYKFEIDYNGVRPYDTQAWCCSGPGAWSKYITLERHMNGLYFSVKLHCGIDFICDDFDYSNDPWAKTMARTILLMSRVSIYTYILGSNSINRYSLLSEPEHLMGKIKNLNKQIEDRMDWLSQNIPQSATDCWSCVGGISVGQIIV